jgi:hypothetical protein
VGEKAVTFWWALNVPGITPIVFVIQAESIEDAISKVMHRMKSWYGEDPKRRELMGQYLQAIPPKLMMFEDGIGTLSIDTAIQPQA